LPVASQLQHAALSREAGIEPDRQAGKGIASARSEERLSPVP